MDTISKYNTYTEELKKEQWDLLHTQISQSNNKNHNLVSLPRNTFVKRAKFIFWNNTEIIGILKTSFVMFKSLSVGQEGIIINSIDKVEYSKNRKIQNKINENRDKFTELYKSSEFTEIEFQDLGSSELSIATAKIKELKYEQEWSMDNYVEFRISIDKSPVFYDSAKEKIARTAILHTAEQKFKSKGKT